jgi:alpha-tubulin suppressor-like RCC1 family protein
MRTNSITARPATRLRRLVHAGLSLALLLFAAAIPVPSESATRMGLQSPTAHAAASLRVAAGDGHTCQVQEDGSVRCWGRNDQGQLGDGSTAWTGTPVTVAGLGGVVAVTAGYAHSCALLADGTVRCWGSNTFGQLGDGSTSRRPTPVAVSGLSGVVTITAGDFHTCALRVDSGVLCWGRDGFGELGDGDASAALSAVPKGVKDLSSGVVAIAAGGGHTCALLINRRVGCWGRNDRGQVGDGTTSHARSPVQVFAFGGLFGVQAIALAAGGAHTCAVAAYDGMLFCWGAGTFGQLGTGLLRDEPDAVAVAGLSRVAAVVAGRQHTCALLADGSGRCWGDNEHGQLGHADSPRSLTPTPVAGLVHAAALTAGARHGCALLADGRVRCWGRNADGEQGNGVRDGTRAASTVLGSGGSVMARAVVVGGHHSCALRANGSVACWGRNDFGQVGNGGFDPQLLPAAVPGLSQVLAVAAGGRHSCALVADGSVHCWGANDRGQLGDGTLTARPVPVPVVGVEQALAVTAGGEHSCALLSNMRAVCWGANGSGQLGDGSLIDRLTAVAVAIGPRLRGLAAGYSRTCALNVSPINTVSVDCWGLLSDGRLALVPDTLTHDLNVVDLAVGAEHACALRFNGLAQCWGRNDFGQGGGGPGPAGETSRTVFGLNPPIALAAGLAHSCAVIADGSASCWGDNRFGQLGDTTTQQRTALAVVSYPFLKRTASGATYAIAPLTQIVQMAAGGHHSCLLRANGAVHCTGENSFGQLGLGTNSDVAYPAQVPSFTLNIEAAVALAHGARVATVTLLAACSAGQELHFDVTLRQGGTLGQRRGTAPCGDGLARLPITLPAQGRDGFDAGPGLVEATARIVERGLSVDTQSWTRRVQLHAAE